MEKYLFLIFILSTAANAATSSVFCKVENKIYRALSENGHWACKEPLALDGSACFTGKRNEVIEQINARAFDWDEEWLEDAHFKGVNSISYLSVDGPNELKLTLSMNRCSVDFFRK